MRKLLFLTYFLSLFGFSTNIFIYPGFLENRLGINPFVLLILFVIIGILTFYFDPKDDNKFFNFVNLINNKLLLPISFFLSLIFSIIELQNYENYVYSTFGGLHFFDLAFVFLISYLLMVLQSGKNEVSKNYPSHLFNLSLVLLFVHAVQTTRSDFLLMRLTAEDGPVENVQFLLFFLSGLIGLLISKQFKNRKNTFSAILYFLVSMAALFTAGEEISWGQRILGIETPQTFQQVNVSNEINIHNIPILFEKQYIVYSSIALYGSFSWLLHKTFLKKRLGKLLNFFTPPKYLFLYFFPMLIYNNLYIHYFGTYDELEEFLELMLVMGIFIFMLQNYLRLKRKSLSV